MFKTALAAAVAALLASASAQALTLHQDGLSFQAGSTLGAVDIGGLSFSYAATFDETQDLDPADNSGLFLASVRFDIDSIGIVRVAYGGAAVALQEFSGPPVGTDIYLLTDTVFSGGVVTFFLPLIDVDAPTPATFFGPDIPDTQGHFWNTDQGVLAFSGIDVDLQTTTARLTETVPVPASLGLLAAAAAGLAAAARRRAA